MLVPFHSALGVLGTLTVLLGLSTRPLQPAQIEPEALMASWDAPWVERLTAPDPAVEMIISDYVKSLEADGWQGPDQGIWIQSGNMPVAQHRGEVPLSAASLTKIATTLAALHTWGAEHQFVTRVGVTGPVEAGVLNGDLVVRGDGDPLFVWEEAIALANTLQDLGIQRVAGNLVIQGDFAMNFKASPAIAGDALKQAFHGDLWPREAYAQFETLPPGTPVPTLQIDGEVQFLPRGEISWIVEHRSLPMVALLKAMNIYSNNAMAEMIANQSGGAAAVVATVNQVTGLAGEISLINGSGLGEENRISARATVAMLTALQSQLQEAGYSVADVMPIAGIDVGTLKDRQLPSQSAAKTGSLAAVSALAGFVPTRDRGPVWFAIINRGWALDDLRGKQDALLQAIQDHWGEDAAPPSFTTKIRLDRDPYRLGDPKRNQVLP